MPPVTGVAVYFVLWWIVLFAVLPIGTRPETEGDAASGGWRGTPREHGVGWKMLVTTGVTTLLWLAIHWLVGSSGLSFREGWLAMPGN